MKKLQLMRQREKSEHEQLYTLVYNLQSERTGLGLPFTCVLCSCVLCTVLLQEAKYVSRELAQHDFCLGWLEQI
jgi:hypothetical protein